MRHAGEVNNPAACNGAWNLIRCRQRCIDPRGIRQMDASHPLDSLPAEINEHGGYNLEQLYRRN